MFGVFLMGISAAFDELASSIGKKKMSDGSESYYTFGFLSQFSSAIFLALSGFLFHHLVFSPESLPTFIPRVLVAILELQIAVIAVAKADRGSFGIIKLATIPLLLITDLVLGYALTIRQVLGMILIAGPILILFFRDRFRAKGSRLVLIVATLAAIDISLYKYDISHFNSVESEAAIMALIISLYFFLAAIFIRRENPLQFLKRPLYFLQASSSGLANVLGSFAYLFASASVITTAFRGFSVLCSILTGRFYFQEKGFVVRILLFLLIAIGLASLI